MALPSVLLGMLASSLLTVNTIFWCILMMVVAALKLAPHAGWRRTCTRVLRWMGSQWIAVTNSIIRRLPVNWDIEIPGDLHRDRSYLVIANHQSWTDIPVLLQIFDHRIPFPVFFVKKELLWFPFIGIAMWALDFPFVERHSREELKRHPELRGRDLATARRACEEYREMAVTLVIFPEGTRFTPAKHQRQGSPFQHLLHPRPGGLSVAFSVLGDRFDALFDLTIAYPSGRSGFWEFLSGRVPKITARVQRRDILPHLRGDYAGDLAYRTSFQAWEEDVWREKDALIGKLLEEAAPADRPAHSR